MELDPSVLERLTDIQRRFLSVSLDKARVHALLADLGAIVQADAGFAAWLDDGEPWLVCWRTGPQIAAYMARTFAGVDREGNIRSHDPDLDALNRTRRALGGGVHHERALAERDSITNTAYFREAFQPAGMPRVIGMTARLSVGEAVFAFGFQTPESPGFASGRTEALLKLVFASFEAGFQAIDHRHRHRERLEAALRGSPLPAHILGPGDPPVTGSLLQLPLPQLGADTAGRVAHLGVGPVGPSALAAALAQGFGLTPRQTEVAALLLEGRSARAIAAHLGVAYNTARRHCEAILQKTAARHRGELPAIAGACLPVPGQTRRGVTARD